MSGSGASGSQRRELDLTGVEKPSESVGAARQLMPGNVVPFTALENEMITKLSWQAWDWLVDRLARGSADELRGFVSEPERLIDNRKNIAVVAQDAVPVYLDLSNYRQGTREGFKSG